MGATPLRWEKKPGPALFLGYAAAAGTIYCYLKLAVSLKPMLRCVFYGRT